MSYYNILDGSFAGVQDDGVGVGGGGSKRSDVSLFTVTNGS